MDAISGDSGSSAWSQDPELMQKLDETYRKHLRPHIDTDGSRNIVAKVAWESYCFELGGVFSKQFPGWKSAIAYFQNLSRDYDCLGPIITSSYIEDLNSLWTEVHPALLEVNAQNYSLLPCLSLISPVQVTRWLEPFIDHGPDYLRATPLYDATIALGRHARELFNRQGGPKEPAISSAIRANNVSASQTFRLACANVNRNSIFKADAAPLRAPVGKTSEHAARDGVRHDRCRFARR